MRRNLKFKGYVDKDGNIVIPKEISSAYGLNPGSKIYFEGKESYLRMHQPVSHLKKVYVEPTSYCNLNCRTCIRNGWDEPLGQMSGAVFSRIIESLRAFSPAPNVFFGGLGEPLTHPDIVDMVSAAKRLGSHVELITNGILLSKTMSKRLIEAGLDMIWISLDGATPESYSDVRLGAGLPQVLSNLKDFHTLRLKRNVILDPAVPEGYTFYERPYIGIAFVAMKSNIRDLPALLALCSQFAVSHLKVSNVLPYTKEMRNEILYNKAISYISPVMRLELPLMDADENTKDALYEAGRIMYGLNINGTNPEESLNRCPFIEKGATAISWAGDVSPCLPLLHTYISYVDDREHRRRRYPVGNIAERDLKDIWNLPEYVSFRENVEMFDFSPCTLCGGCDLSESNETDCIGSIFPTCGNCPWAQGIVQCP